MDPNNPDIEGLSQQLAEAVEGRSNAEARATAADKRATTAEERATAADARATTAEERATAADARATIAEKRASTAEERSKNVLLRLPTGVKLPQRRGTSTFVGFVLLIAFLFVVAWFADSALEVCCGKRETPSPRVAGAQVTWLVGLAVVFVGVLIAGRAVNGRWSGAFIDSRNRYSFSQVQAILWLVIVSSTVVAAAVTNVKKGDTNPLDLAIPAELLAVIGISLTTAVGAPVIRSVKRSNTPDDEQVEKANLGSKEQVAGHEGTVVVFKQATSSGWSDVIRGEEIANWDKVDVGKLQLIYFTAVGAFVYCAAIFVALAPGSADQVGSHIQFPTMDASLIGILGLSNLGALAYLAAPHAKTV